MDFTITLPLNKGKHSHKHQPHPGSLESDHGHTKAHAHGAHDCGGLHSHHHFPIQPPNFDSIFACSMALNTLLVLIQAGAGWFYGSMSLLADAAHNFGDVLALGLSWGASYLTRLAPTRNFTYGFKSSSILAASVSAFILLLITGGIIEESLRRFMAPHSVQGPAVMAVASLGIVINGFSAILFALGQQRTKKKSGQKSSDVNITAAFWHMVSDAMVSVGIVVAGGLIALTGWLWLDPMAGLIVSALIVWGTWGFGKEALWMMLQAVPKTIHPDEVRRDLSRLPGVSGLHDLHIWAMSTTENALTCHLLMPEGHPGDKFFAQVATMLNDKHQIGHATFQVEIGGDVACNLEPEHVV